MRARVLAVLLALAATTAPVAGRADGAVPQDRSVDVVVLKGSQFPTWSAGADPTFREPQTPTNYDTADAQQYLPEPLRSDCYKRSPNQYDPNDNGDHSCYQGSRLPRNPLEGAPIDRLLGYRWNGSGFEQIPFQVDERFTRYLSNNASGFAFYSGVDQHNTFAWDREGFRFTGDESQYVTGGNPCLAKPARNPDGSMGPSTTADPVKGLDDDDEIVFMYEDARTSAPAGTALPSGIDSSYEIGIADPSNPGVVRYAYVMLSKADGPRAAFDASNGYVRYDRDANADIFAYSQSSYDGYGAAAKGPYCTPDGARDTSRGEIAQRRPLDRATVRTDRYKFRYEGRWLMTGLHVSADRTGLATDNYGPDLVDQWKARAFQQRPGGETPCCGYEEEVNNWGGSSILFGERVGPVRAIRAAWGADSSTNNVRQEIFTRDQILFDDYLRVHVIPPFDGIYVQWDYNAGKVQKYFNPLKPEGVAIDGKNDEVFGNTYFDVENDRVEVRDEDPIPVVGPTTVGGPTGAPEDNGCDLGSDRGVCNDIDIVDPTFSGPAGNLNWEQIAGTNGTLVTRWTLKEHTPGGTAQGVIAQPYYRDDSCFDDGTGSDPGPHLRSRNVDNGSSATYVDPADGETKSRVCWTPEDGDPSLDPAGPRKFWQGDIATHGLHINIITDSDNANMTVPLTEIVSEQRMVVLAPTLQNVGETYGRSTEFPLQAAARVFA